jgi:hypothetical protein
MPDARQFVFRSRHAAYHLPDSSWRHCFFFPLFPLICLFLPFSGDLMLPPGHDMRVISSIEFFCFNLARGLG